MASTPTGEAPLPPLTLEHLRSARRIVVASTASAASRDVALRAAETLGIELVVTVVMDGKTLRPPGESDVLVHGTPDVFGRILDPPSGWQVLHVVDRLYGREPDPSPWRIDVGEVPDHPVAVLSAALARLDKRLRQQRGVRPVFSSPPALGLPYIAPDGLALPGGFGRVERPRVPGLADLAVVRPAGDPSELG